jgi:hypothetical protein
VDTGYRCCNVRRRIPRSASIRDSFSIRNEAEMSGVLGKAGLEITVIRRSNSMHQIDASRRMDAGNEVVKPATPAAVFVATMSCSERQESSADSNEAVRVRAKVA